MKVHNMDDHRNIDIDIVHKDTIHGTAPGTIPKWRTIGKLLHVRTNICSSAIIPVSTYRR